MVEKNDMKQRGSQILVCIIALMMSISTMMRGIDVIRGYEHHTEINSEPPVNLNTNFSVPTLVTTNLDSKLSPNVCVTEDGRIHVAWSERQGSDYNVFFSYSTNNGTSFAEPIRVNNLTTGHQYNPRMTVNEAGIVFITWMDQFNDGGDIFLARSLDGGITFEQCGIVHSDNSGVQSFPDIAVNGDDVAVVWEYPPFNNTISIWNAVTGELSRVLEGHNGAVRTVEYSPDGTLLASGGEDNLAKIWNPLNGSVIQNLTDHTQDVMTLNWSSDGSMLATGSFDKNVTIWDTSTYNIITKLNQVNGEPISNYVRSVSFSPDSSQIAVGYSGKRHPMQPQGPPVQMFNLTVWNLTDYSNWTVNEYTIGHTNEVMDVSFSHNGTLIASCSKDDRVKVWNATSGGKLLDLDLGTRDVLSVSWSPDDTQIAAGLENGTIVVFDLADTTAQYWLKSHTSRVNALSWSEVRDGIASGASESKAKIWDLNSKTERLNLSDHENSVYSVDWSTDGDFIATGGGNSAQYNMGEKQIMCAVSADTGQSFSTPITVSDNNNANKYRPRIDMDSSGNIHAVWYMSGSWIGIYYTNSSEGETFNGDVTVSVGSEWVTPDIAVEGNGRAHVVWQQKNGVTNIHYANTTDGFGNDIELSDGQMPRICCSPSGSVILATWRDTNYSLVTDMSYDGGASFVDRIVVNSTMISDSSVTIDTYCQASIVWMDWFKQNIYYVSTVHQDNWAPSIIGTIPADNDINVNPETPIQIDFSEPMNQTSVENGFSMTDGGTVITASNCTIMWNDYHDKVNFTPATALSSSTLYTVTINQTSKDISGNCLLSDHSFSFTTLNCSISLQLGWNLISLPLVQVDESIDQVLNSIDGKWDCIQIYDPLSPAPWISHATFRPDQLNGFDTLNHKSGFWIHTTEVCTLSVHGVVPASTSIPLHAGWNLVGYPSMNNQTVADALWGTGADIIMVGDASEPYNIRLVGPTYVMHPGEGYWVHVVADTIWVVDW